MQTDRDPGLDRGFVLLAIVLIIGAAAVLLDTTIVSVGLAAMARDLGASEASVSWISTAYLLSVALVTPVAGWAADRFGAKPVWMFSLAVFLLGSILCGAAWSITSLVAFRALKGIGGGMILPLCQAIIAQAAGPERFGRAMTMVSLPALFAPVMGPVLGGFIVDGLGWRWIFFINVPICLIALALAWRLLPATTERRHAPMDWIGLLLLPPGLTVLTYGLTRVDGVAGLADPGTAGPLLLGVALVAGFCVHALRVAEPLIDLRLFAGRAFSASSALTFLHGVASYGPLLILPLFYARVRGYDASTIGWLLAPQGLGTVIVLTFAGVLADRVGPRPLVLWGSTAAVLGSVVFTQLANDPDAVTLGVSLAVRGFGLGLVGVAVATAAYRDISAGSIARATGAISVVHRLGASSGTAVMAVILAIQLAGIGASPTGHDAAAAYGNTFLWGLIFMLVTFIPALLLPGTRPHPVPAAVDAADRA